MIAALYSQSNSVRLFVCHTLVNETS